jgi:aminoglycoside/choline kinase family phosphotransferase
MSSLDELELAWFRILATQFHCRVIGQFIKFAVQNNNTRYLQYIPRLENYIHQALKDPLLQPLKAFFDNLNLDFSQPCALNISECKKHIREDAF